MILKLDEPRLLGDAVGIVSEVVSEVRIKLLEDGLSIVAVDPANVAMVVFKLPKESFSQYDAGGDVWGVNLDDLKKILKRASGSASVVFEEEEGKLKITIYDRVKRIFRLSLIDVSSTDKDLPELKTGARVEMNSTDFAQAVEDAGIVATSCSFDINDEIFAIEGSGSLNSARAEFSKDSVELFGIGRATYSLEYLAKFIKATKISDNVVVNFSSDDLLKLDFPGDRMGIGFLLAPRVEND